MSKDTKLGIALYVSRRFIKIYDLSEKKYLDGKTESRHLEVTPGDYVQYHEDKKQNEITIKEVIKRKNILRRSYDKKVKNLASNIDELWIVTAPPPLHNALTIDRTISSAYTENIPVKILANKSDLESFNIFFDEISFYQTLVSKVIPISALNKVGIDKLEINSKISDEKKCKIIAITGVSGVGKSSLINYINPKANADYGIVSEKTGQGKQTTSAALGYIIDNNLNAPVVIIDLPGIQNYGVSHLTFEEMSTSMTDIYELSENCKFRDCKHIKEPNCAVLKALNENLLKESRYKSYLDMKNEIESIKSY